MRTTIRSVAFLCVAALAYVVPATPADAAAPKWTSASRARIHPGVQTVSPSGQCTANFVFYDSKYAYIGQAAHCTSKGDNLDTNGCITRTYPVGTRIRIEGASRSGVMVYNSWQTMQQVRESSASRCLGNDFALVRIDPADRSRVNPSIPFWGGPRGLARPASEGDELYSYGDSGLRAGVEQLSPKAGISTGSFRSGWSHGMYMLTPGVPGDSGSAVLDSRGRALGVLSTLNALPFPGENTAADLTKALAYMKVKTSLDAIQLASGTVPFSGLL